MQAGCRNELPKGKEVKVEKEYRQGKKSARLKNDKTKDLQDKEMAGQEK